MRINLVHRTIVDYTTETPYQRGVGGSDAANAYLAAELARLGHDVMMVTNTSTPGRFRGVECLNKSSLSKDLLNGADVSVVINESCGRELREKFGVTKPLVFWTGHADDQPSIEGLEFTRERKAWNGFAFVSEWQLGEFCRVFWVPAEKSRVLRNAISPAFAELTPPEPWFRRNEPPVLVYTSAPYRGLDVLLSAFPSIRAAIPGTRLKIFSNLGDMNAPGNEYSGLQRQARAIEGVEYAGSIGQAPLAIELQQAAALAYPSTFNETSCIAALEAMAAGALVLTARSAALPETTAGFGKLVDPHPDRETYARAFAAMAIESLQSDARNPSNALARRERQIAFVRQNYTWPGRALEWQAWLLELVRRPG
jgi:glycosyltransferase involved in cell wall biosynthesis